MLTIMNGNSTQELYHSGARRIGIIGAPPIGCMPSQRTLAGGIERECVTLYNEAATMFNSQLSKEVQRLDSTLLGSKIVYIDIYTPLLDMILRPFAYGNFSNKRIYGERPKKILFKIINKN